MPGILFIENRVVECSRSNLDIKGTETDDYSGLTGLQSKGGDRCVKHGNIKTS